MRVRHALMEAVRLDPDRVETGDLLETVDLEGAAAILHTSPRAVYTRYSRGKMPRPITRKPLVWRRADLLRLGA